MKKITTKEEEVMNLFWEKGPMFVREMLEFYDEPKPHFNTVSTYVRELEVKGYLGHKAYGKNYQYYPLINREEYKSLTLSNVVDNYFNKSYLSAVSSLVKEENISIGELKQLIKDVEEGNNKK